MSLSATNNISNSQGTYNVNNGYILPLNMGRACSTNNLSKRKQNRSMRGSISTTSSALALLAFLFFLNILQRSLDDNKQGPVLMTRVTKQAVIRPRNDFIEDKQSTILDNNNMVTKFEKMYNK
ncbi:uncharacterized protein LOC114131157 [Aphis gossypii]|uniref:uncharacterized protein LOC114131157 n=1 Tax=Aphis gossypii TaxID=80765 RepID=UPI002158B7DA|nr:uncharacterized protein LOC114131157 [Aphis gossypii]